jgi:molybdopterin-guanine dinucleotide biosynthesis protein B
MKIFGFAGWSGSGKTTLIEQLIPRFVDAGLRVSLVKHAHHRFDIDVPGKDSYRHRKAGATEVMVASDTRWALMHELRGAPEPDLEQLIARMSPCDLMLIEGFKHHRQPKLEVYRKANGKPRLHLDDPEIVGIASDAPFDTALPQFGLDDIEAIARFVMQYNGFDPR